MAWRSLKHSLSVVVSLTQCIYALIGFGLNLGDSEVRCIEEDRQALLKFKQGLKDHLGLLLISLDLSRNCHLIEVHNLDWLFYLSSLKQLDVSNVNLSQVVNWLDKVNMLPSLLDLCLSSCDLSMPIPCMLSNASSSSSPLLFIDISVNHLNSLVFPWLFKYSNKLVLSLDANLLEGPIPTAFGKMVALVHLHLSFNNLEWMIPQTLRNLHNLKVLDLSNNNINGELPDLAILSCLKSLHLHKNRLNGSLTKSIGKLSKLEVLDVSSNSLEGGITEATPLSLNFSLAWVPPFHLDILRLSFCKNITCLVMFNATISNTIPHWFWDFSSNTSSSIPLLWFSSRFIGFPRLDLSFNRFIGLLPQLHPNTIVLNLSNNLFQRSITSICETNVSYLTYLDLSTLSRLETLHLQKNNLVGKLLDLRENKLSGRIPAWMGNSLPHLVVLHLPSNFFNGSIHLQLCHLTFFQILDLSDNNITGTILSNVSIAYEYISFESYGMAVDHYIDSIVVIFKEKYFEYDKILGLLKFINLSSNKLEGGIPREITKLSRLIGLNIIDGLESLNFLDLSMNHLLGTIPQSLATLGPLNYLNLSNNNLSGNRDLCGSPLPKCPGDKTTQEHAYSYEKIWFYTTVVLKFIVGFWGVCGPLLLKNSWRHAYFQYLDRIGDRIYVTVAVNKAKLLRSFKTR
ncbi:hypothetical protein CIPAW_05G228300 [Carya illinoinensis]|uniref:Receptor-like protein 12 n=1 Tax=Carya illinoinensis TaxID=32201 RepID=A0A8T1QLE9_CARIL|nr:hypothetical protein CIPAW_05G228300 [Carya illinoinensis]